MNDKIGKSINFLIKWNDDDDEENSHETETATVGQIGDGFNQVGFKIPLSNREN